MIKSLRNIFLLLFFSSCIGGQTLNSHSQDENLGKDQFCADPSDTEFCDAMEIIAAQCIDCHTGRHNTWINYDTTKKWLDSGEIAPGDPDGSPLIFWLKNVGGTMPKEKPTLSESDYQKLRLWITNAN